MTEHERRLDRRPSRLCRLAEGNAFYLEELIRATAEGRTDELPETVLAMVEGHLSRLSGEERRVLRAASVFGEVCWESAVSSLLGGAMGATSASALLEALVSREILVRRRDSRFAGEQELAFRHALLRDGAHALLTEEDLRVGHRLAGLWLESHGEADPAALGEHFERGHEFERAAHFYTLAAELAIVGNDLEGALGRAERGLACGVVGPARGALLACQSLAHFWRADHAAVMRCGTEALSLLSSGSQVWCRCMFAMVGTASTKRLSDLSPTLLAAEPAEGARASYQETASMLVISLSWAGARDAVHAVVSRMEQVDAGAPLPDAGARGWLKLSVGVSTNAFQPDPWACWCAQGEARRLFEECGNRRMAAISLGTTGLVEAELFGIERAEATLREGLAMVQPTGEWLATVICRAYLALLLARHGASETLDEARALAEEVLGKVGRRTFYAGHARCVLAHVARRRGGTAEAVDQARAAREILAGAPGFLPIGLTTLIEVLLAAGRRAEARSVGDEGLALIEALGGAGNHEVPLRLAAAEARLAAGDRAAATEAIRGAVAALTERARWIPDEAVRAHYLSRAPQHVRIAELARSLGVDGGSARTMLR